MLGQREDIKELGVERLCLHFELWLDSLRDNERPRMKALDAAAAAIDAEIRRRTGKGDFATTERGFDYRMNLVDNGQLYACHDKLLRRYDILMSSIGSGHWRSEMPYRGTDGLGRADELETYLAPIAAWTDGAPLVTEYENTELAAEIHGLLGERDETKLFLDSLLVSLLRPQGQMAREAAERVAAEESARNIDKRLPS